MFPYSLSLIPSFSLLKLTIARAYVYFGLLGVSLYSVEIGDCFSLYLLGFPRFVGLIMIWRIYVNYYVGFVFVPVTHLYP